jgi:hypothetical protein
MSLPSVHYPQHDNASDYTTPACVVVDALQTFYSRPNGPHQPSGGTTGGSARTGGTRRHLKNAPDSAGRLHALLGGWRRYLYLIVANSSMFSIICM